MSRSRFRIGQGYDIHALAPGRPLWVCGLRIEHFKGAIAHSDGDVAIHALCDALLGALALGDIGRHFPDRSPEYKGIDSKTLLSRVYEMVLERGYHVVNLDITIGLENPKISEHIEEMRAILAGILGCELGDVSIKATTAERLGFVGREEGVEAWASVLLER